MPLSSCLRVLLVSPDRSGALREQLMLMPGVHVVGVVAQLKEVRPEADVIVLDRGLVPGSAVPEQWRDDSPTVRRWVRAADRAEILSPRERAVFLLLGEGYSNRQIAQEIGVTERTTKEHASRVLEKLEVDSRLQAGLISFAHRLRRHNGGR
jgi:DNA-binding NarL/FixJ family response regulator